MILTKTEFLYGIKPKKLKKMKYYKAIRYKLKKAKELMDELYEVSLYSRDEDRIYKVHKAIQFNEKLLDEAKV